MTNEDHLEMALMHLEKIDRSKLCFSTLEWYESIVERLRDFVSRHPTGEDFNND